MNVYLEVLIPLIVLAVGSVLTWYFTKRYYKLTEKDIKLSARMSQIGLDDVIASCRDFGPDKKWSALIENPKHIVEILGYSMHETFENEDFIKNLSYLIEKTNILVRILLASPTSPLIRERAYSLNIDYDSFVKRIYDSQQKLSKIIDPKNMIVGKRDIRTFSDILIPYSMIRVDDKMYVIPYISSHGKRNSPILVIKGQEKELFQKFKVDFIQAWEKSQPLHNPRVRVPSIYTQISSEKDLIAQCIARKYDEISHGQPSDFHCLDIGCGDGTQSILTFNKLAENIKSLNITFIDPSSFSVQVCEESLLLKRLSFTPLRPVLQRRWQEYETDKKFQLIFCCHVLGSIYQQSNTDEDFRRQLERMISILDLDGQLCIVLASEKSVELQLRRRDRIALKNILSSEDLAKMLRHWGIVFDEEKVNSLFTLEGWLGKGRDEVSPQEREVLYFLFSPFTDLTCEIAEKYRDGLRSNSRKWTELGDEEKNNYLINGAMCNRGNVKDDDLFAEMSHVCFWIEQKRQLTKPSLELVS